MRTKFTWIAIAAIVLIPVLAAATSPLLAWRDPVYITAGFAGIIALILLIFQPLTIGGYLPNLNPKRRRLLHRWGGVIIVLAIVIHVAGLWLTSPPDMMDALTFTSPTPFSAWGVIAMWLIFSVAVLAFFRRRLRPNTWHIIHFSLVPIIVISSVVHAALIDGTMETITKVVLCILLVWTTTKVLRFFILKK